MENNPLSRIDTARRALLLKKKALKLRLILARQQANSLRYKYSLLSGSNVAKDTTKSHTISKTCKQPLPSRLSPIYDSRYSILKNLASYRLTTRFNKTGLPITDLRYAHNIYPRDFVCLPDLIGTCSDKSCLYQHKSNYFMSDIEKLVDILSYKPSLTGFKPDPSLNKGENERKCRLQLKQYSARLLTKNPDKSVEAIAQSLVNYVRGNKSNHELLTMTRELPKVSHTMRNFNEHYERQ